MSSIAFATVRPSSSSAVTVFDLTEKHMRRVEVNTSGFLKPGETLRDVCIRDWTALEKLNISCDQISDSLFSIIERAEQIARKEFALSVNLNDQFLISIGNFIVCKNNTNDNFQTLVVNYAQGPHLYFFGRIHFKISGEWYAGPGSIWGDLTFIIRHYYYLLRH